MNDESYLLSDNEILERDVICYWAMKGRLSDIDRAYCLLLLISASEHLLRDLENWKMSTNFSTLQILQLPST
jgi:hypothetical protein